MTSLFCRPVSPDWEGLLQSITRTGTPRRVHHIELFLDVVVQDALCERFGLLKDLDSADPHYELRKQIVLQSFLGYDSIRCGVEGVTMPFRYDKAPDTSGLQHKGGERSFIDEHKGPITTWEECEAYPWPDLNAITTRALEWYERNLPDGMCIIAGGGFGHFTEYLTWLMGYETFCLALYEQRDLVRVLADRCVEQSRVMLTRMLQFDCVKMVWGSDDMGFRTGPLVSPDDLREFVLPGHKLMAEMAHAAGRPYLLHCCGNIGLIMDDLIDDVRIDAKHSFEDVIEDVVTAKQRYGDRIALLGGIDLDFLCRATPEEVRARVRRTLDACMPGGGYCLGTGNSVANYVPIDNYLAMLDEGRRYSG